MAHFVYTGLKANLPEVRENAFYLCTDTREIYFGADLFTEAVRTYTGEKPATPATGVLYVNTDTKVGGLVVHGYSYSVDRQQTILCSQKIWCLHISLVSIHRSEARSQFQQKIRL